MLTSPALICVTTCDTSLKNLQVWGLKCFTGEPVPIFNDPFSEEMFLNVQPEFAGEGQNSIAEVRSDTRKPTGLCSSWIT